jgi:hypothetical protein
VRSPKATFFGSSVVQVVHAFDVEIAGMWHTAPSKTLDCGWTVVKWGGPPVSANLRLGKNRLLFRAPRDRFVPYFPRMRLLGRLLVAKGFRANNRTSKHCGVRQDLSVARLPFPCGLPQIPAYQEAKHDPLLTGHKHGSALEKHGSAIEAEILSEHEGTGEHEVRLFR